MIIKSLIASCALTLGLSASNAAAQNNHTEQQAEPINDMCPIGKEPFVPSAGTVQYKGHTIALCCPGCGESFLAWDEQRKDDFVELALENREPGQEHHATDNAPADEAASDAASGPTYPYTLDSCPIGGKLGSMGEPIIKVYNNREVRFCCANCIETFETDMDTHWDEIDTKIVDQQLMHYPIDTCIVTGQPLGDNAINHVHNNRLVRLADTDALATFKADPAEHLRALDQEIIQRQLPDYPMDTCPVGGQLGSMGEPVNFIYMNRLVRFCCSNCEDTLTADPQTYLAKLDQAYADAQRDDYPLDTCVVSGSPLGSMGEPAELVAGTTLIRFCCDGCFPTFKAQPHKHLSKLTQE